MTRTIKEERNDQGLLTYREYSDGSWEKFEYDKNGFINYMADSDKS